MCVFLFLKTVPSLRNMLNEAPALSNNLGERERLQFCPLFLRFLHWHRGIPVNAAGRMLLVQQRVLLNGILVQQNQRATLALKVHKEEFSVAVRGARHCSGSIYWEDTT